jgi:hypothetical protein
MVTPVGICQNTGAHGRGEDRWSLPAPGHLMLPRSSRGRATRRRTTGAATPAAPMAKPRTIGTVSAFVAMMLAPAHAMTVAASRADRVRTSAGRCMARAPRAQLVTDRAVAPRMSRTPRAAVTARVSGWSSCGRPPWCGCGCGSVLGCTRGRRRWSAPSGPGGQTSPPHPAAGAVDSRYEAEPGCAGGG